MIILAAIALVLQDQDAYAPPQDAPPAAAQSAPSTDRRARRNLQRRLESAGDLYEALGRCTGSMSIEEVQSLLADARGEGPAGEYLTGRFEAGLRRPRDSDEWCRQTIGKLSSRF